MSGLTAFLPFILLSVLVAENGVDSLECYTGYSVVRGRTVGTSTETCKKKSDQCYKASIDATALNRLKLAGCSTFRCMAASNRCASQQIGGQHVELCCCKEDLCNAHQPKSTVDKVKGLLSGLAGGGLGGSGK